MPKKANFPRYLFDGRSETTSSFRRRWNKCQGIKKHLPNNGRGQVTRHGCYRPAGNPGRPKPHAMPNLQGWIGHYPWTAA